MTGNATKRTRKPKREKTTEELVAQYNKNGWVPVPYDHHPERVQQAIKAARLRPAMKNCYANSQRLLTGQHEVEFKYYEGIVAYVIPIQHAWLELDGEVVDVTIKHPTTILAKYECSKKEVFNNMVQTRAYGPVHEERLNVLQLAIMYGIEPSNDYEGMKNKVIDVQNSLIAMRRKHEDG